MESATKYSLVVQSFMEYSLEESVTEYPLEVEFVTKYSLEVQSCMEYSLGEICYGIFSRSGIC